MAASLLGLPLDIEGDEARQQFLLGGLLGGRLVRRGQRRAGPADDRFAEVVPAIGFEGQAVDLVVHVLQHRHQPGLVDGALLAGEGLDVRPRPFQLAQALHHIVEPGHGEKLVLGQPRLAKGVEPLAGLGQFLAQDAGLESSVRQAGKREGVE